MLLQTLIHGRTAHREDILPSPCCFHFPPSLGPSDMVPTEVLINRETQQQWAQPHLGWLAGSTARIDKSLKVHAWVFTNLLICW